MVAWLTLNTVEDDGRTVPQYLAADRVGSPEVDFTHIRVFTWWSARQQYATAYVESNLQGYFPIRVQQVEGAPHFRLRLVDRSGQKIQKVWWIPSSGRWERSRDGRAMPCPSGAAARLAEGAAECRPHP
jgi:hypothetical protein